MSPFKICLPFRQIIDEYNNNLFKGKDKRSEQHKDCPVCFLLN